MCELRNCEEVSTVTTLHMGENAAMMIISPEPVSYSVCSPLNGVETFDERLLDHDHDDWIASAHSLYVQPGRERPQGSQKWGAGVSCVFEAAGDRGERLWVA